MQSRDDDIFADLPDIDTQAPSFESAEFLLPDTSSFETATTIYKTNDLFSPRVETSSYEEFETAMNRFNTAISAASDLIEQKEALDFDAIKQRLKYVEELGAAIVNLVEVTNTLIEPSTDRDVRIGELFLPMTIFAWKNKAPEGNATLLNRLHNSMHERPEVPEWQRNMFRFFVSKSVPGDFPTEDSYLKLSKSLKGRYESLLSDIKEVEEKAQSMEDRNASSRTKIFGEKEIEELREKAKKFREEGIPSLFTELVEEKKDLLPKDATQALAALKSIIMPHGAIIQAFQKYISALERFCVGLCFSHSGRNVTSSMNLAIPVFTNRGIDFSEQKIETSVLKSSATSADNVSRVLKSLFECKKALRSMTLSFPAFTSDTDVDTAKIFRIARKSLCIPFQDMEEHGAQALRLILNSKDPRVLTAGANLLANPWIQDVEDDTWAYALDKPQNHKLLAITLSKYITSQLEDADASLEQLLQCSTEVEAATYNIARHTKEFCKTEKYSKLAKFLNTQLLEQTDQNKFKAKNAICLLLVLHHLSQDENTSERLRYQIPKIENLKEMAEQLGKEFPSLADFFESTAHTAIVGFSVSAADFFAGKHAPEIKECLDAFRFMVAHPEIRQGIAGNKLMRSGIGLVGEPGVGKTHLADLIINELGLKRFTVPSMEESSEDQKFDMLSEARKAFDEAIKYVEQNQKPCAIWIDEAEAVTRERSLSTTTQSQAEVTDYVLQRTNEIRLKHPLILPIIATNYESRIDEAMLRDGRIDYVFRIGLPDLKTRKEVLKQTLAQEGLLELCGENDANLDTLAELTEGFLILPIARTIIETKRITFPIAFARDDSLVLDFEFLKERFLAAKNKINDTNQRREGKGNIYGSTNSETNADDS